METAEIVELTEAHEIGAAFDCMSQLRPHLTPESFVAMVDEMAPKGYRLFAVREAGRIVAVAGVGFSTNLYYGRFLWVYDLVTLAESRSKGHGALLLGHLEEMARAEGCDTVALSSGLKRVDAHRFYEDKMGFEKASYTFKKDLKDEPFMPTPDPNAT